MRLLTIGGFDPRVGLVHGIRYGRESLALDLVEEFRAPMVDRFVLRTLNLKRLTEEDFELQDDGSVRMRPEARRTFLELWYAWLSEPGPLLREAGEHKAGEKLEQGALRVRARPEEGEEKEAEGPAASWEQRMERQVGHLRRFLLEGTEYRELFVVRSGKRKALVVSENGSRSSVEAKKEPEDT